MPARKPFNEQRVNEVKVRFTDDELELLELLVVKTSIPRAIIARNLIIEGLTHARKKRELQITDKLAEM